MLPTVTWSDRADRQPNGGCSFSDHDDRRRIADYRARVTFRRARNSNGSARFAHDCTGVAYGCASVPDRRTSITYRCPEQSDPDSHHARFHGKGANGYS